MATKLNFRARTLDASKPMLVYHSEELPDVADLNAINRSVPAMPSGMEKEEEAEKHLQDILESQERKPEAVSSMFIPTPEVFVATDADGTYEKLYKSNFKTPRAYIHVQPFSADQDQPDYDMDSEDERFLNQVLRDEKKFEVNDVTFEDMIDRLEKNSGHNAVSPKEAKLLLKEDDELILSVYDYWLDKRLRLKMPLIPSVKSDKRDSAAASSSSSTSGSSNPYVAFRRRTEKMQTRKNRKNDEASYEKMLKLRRDLSRAVTLLEMVKRREKTKKENLNLTKDIFEKRFAASDFDGRIIADVLAQRQTQIQQRVLQPAMYRYAENWVNHIPGAGEQTRQKRPYQKKKQRHKSNQSRQHQTLAGYGQVGGSSGSQHKFDPMFGTSLGPLSSDDEGLGGGPDSAASPSDLEEELEEGPFAFRRKRHCQYLAPLVDEDGFERFRGWPWEGPEEGGGAEPKYGYSLASLSRPRRCLGMVRRRVGRGGRIILDRAFSTDHDDFFRSLDFTVLSGVGGGGGDRKRDLADERTSRLFEDWPHYRPVTPPLCQEEPDYDPYFGDSKPSLLPSSSALPVNLGGLLPTAPVKLTPSSASTSKMSAAVNTNSNNSNSSNSTRPQVVFTPTGMRTVSVDSVVAHNAASAVVNSDTIDLFQTQQQQQQSA